MTKHVAMCRCGEQIRTIGGDLWVHAKTFSEYCEPINVAKPEPDTIEEAAF